MKKILKKLGLLTCAAALAVSLASCGDSEKAQEEVKAAQEEVQEILDSVSDEFTPEWNDSGAGAAADVPTDIAFGDYEGFTKLNGAIDTMSGQTVTIDGIFDRSGFSGYSIGQKNGDEYSGRRFSVEGFSESDYPAFGSRIKIKGVIVYDEESWVSSIVVQLADFEVIEPAS